MLTFGDIDDWLEELEDLGGVKSAVLDPAELRTPGVWCKVPAFGIDTAAAGEYRVDLELYLAVGDQKWKKARKELLELFETVHTHLGKPRVAEVPFIKLVLPDGQEVPALRLPHTLRIVPDPA